MDKVRMVNTQQPQATVFEPEAQMGFPNAIQHYLAGHTIYRTSQPSFIYMLTHMPGYQVNTRWILVNGKPRTHSRVDFAAEHVMATDWAVLPEDPTVSQR